MIFFSFLFYMLKSYLVLKAKGESGVPCVAPSCSRPRARQAITSAETKKNAALPLVVRFFLFGGLARHRLGLRPSRDTRSVSLRWRGSVRAAAARGSVAFGAPCSLGASLPAPEPPKRCSLRSQLIFGCRRAPFVMRPCWVARPAVISSER